LHGAFAEGRLADDQAATVILNGCGEDFRSHARCVLPCLR
jgi:hypothetical protein